MLQRPAIPRGPLCSPELIAAEDIGWGDINHGRQPLLRSSPPAPSGKDAHAARESAQAKDSPGGAAGVYRVLQGTEVGAGTADATTSAYFRSVNPWLPHKLAVCLCGERAFHR